MFLDASMAFDNSSYIKLFSILISRDVPMYALGLLWFWYSNQVLLQIDKDLVYSLD